ncbi:MAG TPA: hypothetical protein V6D20_17970 [Candidatus Obscuribacterales bacterium]
MSGESGAGKTESCKTVLAYLSFVSGDTPAVQTLKTQIASSNVILECTPGSSGGCRSPSPLPSLLAKRSLWQCQDDTEQQLVPVWQVYQDLL